MTSSLNLTETDLFNLLYIRTDPLTLHQYNFVYDILPEKEKIDRIGMFMQDLDEHKFSLAGPQKQTRWEEGWKENLIEFKTHPSAQALIPKFYKPCIMRLGQELILPQSPTFRYDLWKIYSTHLFKQYLQGQTHIHEFGCGTGYNLVNLAQLFPHTSLSGSDWVPSSLELIQEINQHFGYQIGGTLFDMFHPNQLRLINENSLIGIPPGAALLTLGAMEQLGKHFHNFLDYLIAARPSLVIHVEPIVEFRHPMNTYEYINIKFAQERNYLRGFWPALLHKKEKKEIELVTSIRVDIADFHHCSWDLVVWRPK